MPVVAKQESQKQAQTSHTTPPHSLQTYLYCLFLTMNERLQTALFRESLTVQTRDANRVGKPHYTFNIHALKTESTHIYGIKRCYYQ